MVEKNSYLAARRIDDEEYSPMGSYALLSAAHAAATEIDKGCVLRILAALPRSSRRCDDLEDYILSGGDYLDCLLEDPDSVVVADPDDNHHKLICTPVHSSEG